MGIWFGISNTCCVRSNKMDAVGEIKEEHDQNCVEDEFQLVRTRLGRGGGGGAVKLYLRRFSVLLFEMKI